jgi:hypothetical protein
MWLVTWPSSAAVTFVQRFGDALDLNVHFYSLVLDGVYARTPEGRLRFVRSRRPRQRRARRGAAPPWRAGFPENTASSAYPRTASRIDDARRRSGKGAGTVTPVAAAFPPLASSPASAPGRPAATGSRPATRPVWHHRPPARGRAVRRKSLRLRHRNPPGAV